MGQESQEQQALLKLSNSGKIESRYRDRVNIILSYRELQNKRGVSRHLGFYRKKVKRWLKRWEDSELLRQEFYEDYQAKQLSYQAYKLELLSVFFDKPRSGNPGKFSLSQKEQIVALASTKPEDLGLPFTHWSTMLLQQEAIARGIVKNISVRQVGRFLKSAPSMSS